MKQLLTFQVLASARSRMSGEKGPVGRFRVAVRYTIATLGLVCALSHRAAAGPALESTHYRVFLHGSAAGGPSPETLVDDWERTHRRIVTFLGVPDEGTPKLDYHVYPSFEAKGLATGNTALAHVDLSGGAVHAVINDWIRGDDPQLAALPLLRRYLGEPASRVLEAGLVIYLSGSWRGSHYAYWAARLYLSGNMLPLSELVDGSGVIAASPLVFEPLAATLVAHLLEREGRRQFLERYRTWRLDPASIAAFEREWHRHVDRLASEPLESIRHKRRHARTGFQKGFCHAHEGYNILDGYLSRKSDEALEKLERIGSNAVSITPFSYMRDPTVPAPFRFSDHPGAENDESVIHAANTARKLGMTLMLKPHIWLGRSWPGAIEMTSEEDWRRFFDDYYRWMRHYAMLAEMYDFDILCIGVELVQATTGHEDEWRRMVQKLRGIFSGEMTYAANWGDEFEKVSFWDALDYIGLNCYYPLSDGDDASDEELERGAAAIVRRVETVHERYAKPILITEIGFTSTRAPWKNPHEAAWRKPAYPHDQARCYSAMFRALYGRGWCRGIYWWKWPSFLEFGGDQNAGFTPNGKPAQQVVERWYRKQW